MLHELKEDAGTDRSRWQGKEWDGEYGQYYFGARYFDPLFGLWTSPDPAGQYADPYSYGGDPANMVDPTGLWSIGAGITFGWDSNRGFHVGVGLASDMGEMSNNKAFSGFGSTNVSYTWHEDGTRSVNASGSGGVNVYGFNLYAGGGYSWNSEGGRVISGYTGANYMGMVGGETGGSVYYDDNWNYQGFTVRQEFYGGAGGNRVYVGYEKGFDGQEGRGAYVGADVLGANAEYAENGGWSYGGSGNIFQHSYNSKTGVTTNSYAFGMYSQNWITLSADYVYGYDYNLKEINALINDTYPDIYTFVGHGSPDYIGGSGIPDIYGNISDPTKTMSATEMASKLKKNQLNYKGESIIMLFSCQTGAKKNGFAYQLSKEMKKIVVAPVGNVIVQYNKDFYSGTRLKSINAQWATFGR